MGICLIGAENFLHFSLNVAKIEQIFPASLVWHVWLHLRHVWHAQSKAWAWEVRQLFLAIHHALRKLRDVPHAEEGRATGETPIASAHYSYVP